MALDGINKCFGMNKWMYEWCYWNSKNLTYANMSCLRSSYLPPLFTLAYFINMPCWKNRVQIIVTGNNDPQKLCSQKQTLSHTAILSCYLDDVLPLKYGHKDDKTTWRLKWIREKEGIMLRIQQDNYSRWTLSEVKENKTTCKWVKHLKIWKHTLLCKDFSVSPGYSRGGGTQEPSRAHG